MKAAAAHCATGRAGIDCELANTTSQCAHGPLTQDCFATMQHFLLRLANLAIPGLGSALAGRGLRALYPGLLLLLVMVILCQLQLPDSRAGLLYAAGALLAVHAFCALAVGLPPRPGFHRSLLGLGIFLPGMLGLCLAVTSFGQPLFGYALYFIPSESMQPALQPADLILVNTRLGDTCPLAPGRIVVFQPPSESPMIYVKHIAAKPAHLAATAPDRYFMLGDNFAHSADSRVFGLVDQRAILGEVKLVLVNLANPQRHLLEAK